MSRRWYNTAAHREQQQRDELARMAREIDELRAQVAALAAGSIPPRPVKPREAIPDWLYKLAARRIGIYN